MAPDTSRILDGCLTRSELEEVHGFGKALAVPSALKSAGLPLGQGSVLVVIPMQKTARLSLRAYNSGYGKRCRSHSIGP